MQTPLIQVFINFVHSELKRRVYKISKSSETEEQTEFGIQIAKEISTGQCLLTRE